MTKIALKKFGFIRIALAAGVGFPLFIATSANAQDPTPKPAAGEATTERVVVVGSNLPTTETESALPVTTYSAELLQKVGANTPAEGLRQLPSYVGNTLTENDSNGGDGSAFITLRGLGPANTLTLIDGRRAFGFSNINALPIGAISRVEILKDGASSVYGSDAVAGVVNFILLDGPGEAPYEGAESFFLYGNTTDHDARVLNGYLKGGVTGLDGKVAIAAVGEYYDRNDIYSRDRVIAALADRRSLGGNNQGSPTFPGRALIRTNPTISSTATEFVLLNPSNNAPTSLADYRTFAPGVDAESFNFRLYTPAIPGMEKASYFVSGRYKIFDDMLQMYGSILYSKTKQDNGSAPSPFAVGASTVNASPFNPFSTGNPATATDNQLQNLRYRLVQELGNRRSFYDYDYYRYTVGFKGDFNVKDNQFVSNWGYDAGFVYERNDQLRIDSGDATATGIFGAITDAVDINGVPTFFNPFIGLTAPTSGDVTTYVNGVAGGTAHYDNTAITALSSYLGHSFFYERDYLYDIKVNGNLFPGLWNGGVGVGVGYEHYNQATHQVPDPVQAAGDQLGFNASPNTKYLREEDAYFGELKIPLVTSTMNWAWMRSAEFSFAYRYETFDNKDQYIHTTSTFDSGGTPRLALRLQPVEDVVLRASWGQSFLSPAAFQLFDPVTQNFPQVVDPAGTSGGAPFQPFEGVWQGGNAALQPEQTDSYSAGVVWTPKFIRDWTGGTFTATVDFYQIFTQNVILPAADLAQLILTVNGNFIDAGGAVGAAPFNIPDVNPGVGGIGVARDDAGHVTFINSQTANAGKRLVNGMDVNVIYQLPTQNWGQFTWKLGYNYFFTWKAEPVAGTGFTSFLGNFTGTLPLAPGAIPYHKGFLSGEWEWRGWDFVATGNYISSYNDDSGNVLAANIIGGTDTNPAYDFYRRVTDYITLDMQLGYEFRKPVTEAVATSYAKDAKDAKSASAPVGGADNGTIYQRMIWNTKVVVGVNNAFDRNPPTTLGAFNDNYDTSLYTVRNRYWYASITKRF